MIKRECFSSYLNIDNDDKTKQKREKIIFITMFLRVKVSPKWNLTRLKWWRILIKMLASCNFTVVSVELLYAFSMKFYFYFIFFVFSFFIFFNGNEFFTLDMFLTRYFSLIYEKKNVRKMFQNFLLLLLWMSVKEIFYLLTSAFKAAFSVVGFNSGVKFIQGKCGNFLLRI